MATIQEALAIAVEHHRSGRLQPAEQISRQILQAEPNQSDALHLLGLIAAQVGKPEVGVEYMTRAAGSQPENPSIHNNLGNALSALGKLDQAAACYRRALELKPDFAQTHHNLGNLLKSQGNLEEATQCYRRALDLRPDLAEAHSNLGVALSNLGDFEKGVASCRRALSLDPGNAGIHNNLGNVLKKQGKLEEAISCYEQALALKPAFAQASYNLGNALKEQGKLDEAAACYRRALERKPDYADALSNLSVVLCEQGNLERAADCCRQVLGSRPDHAPAHNNLGNALKEQGKLDEAVACYRRAIALMPVAAEMYSNLGLMLADLGKLDEAARCYQQALTLDPVHADAHLNQSLLMLLTGDFERGWADYEWRFKTTRMRAYQRQFTQPRWDGQPLGGKTILLHAEQGLGDTIQFVRYAPLVQERGGRVILECQPLLLRILAGCPGIDQLTGAGDPLPAFEVHAPLMSLPGMLGMSLRSIPTRVPYLRADPELTQSWRHELEPLAGFKVGIVWQGNPRVSQPGCRAADKRRSFPLAQFEPLARLPGVRLVSLQKGYGTEQLAGWQAVNPIIELGDRLSDFMDTAAVMMNLDLIISADTAPLHLAGALGRPVWAALPLPSCWRWLLKREDTPWYPTMRLFRQSRPGGWSGVFKRIVAALSHLVERGNNTSETAATD